GLLRQAQARYEELDDEVGAAEAQLLRARLCVEQDDYTSAGAHLQTCWAIFSEWDESRGLARTLYWQGLVQYYLGQLDEARNSHEQALSLQITLGEETDEVATRRALADVALAQQACDTAEVHCRQALAKAR